MSIWEEAKRKAQEAYDWAENNARYFVNTAGKFNQPPPEQVMNINVGVTKEQPKPQTIEQVFNNALNLVEAPDRGMRYAIHDAVGTGIEAANHVYADWSGDDYESRMDRKDWTERSSRDNVNAVRKYASRYANNYDKGSMEDILYNAAGNEAGTIAASVMPVGRVASLLGTEVAGSAFRAQQAYNKVLEETGDVNKAKSAYHQAYADNMVALPALKTIDRRLPEGMTTGKGILSRAAAGALEEVVENAIPQIVSDNEITAEDVISSAISGGLGNFHK